MKVKNAANAKARASQKLVEGTLSSSSKKKIDAKTAKIWGHEIKGHKTLRGVRK